MWSLLIPSSLLAAEDRPGLPTDVQLTEGHQLVGQYVDASGQPLAEQPLALQRGTRLIAEAITDAQGKFQFQNLHGGMYQLQSTEQIIACRCWMPGTAPPKAAKRLLVVGQQDVSRGQHPFPEIFSNPLLIAALIAGAVAIPIAIHNSGDDNNGS
jgi:hypothetical protein